MYKRFLAGILFFVILFAAMAALSCGAWEPVAPPLKCPSDGTRACADCHPRW